MELEHLDEGGLNALESTPPWWSRSDLFKGVASIPPTTIPQYNIL